MATRQLRQQKHLSKRETALLCRAEKRRGIRYKPMAQTRSNTIFWINMSAAVDNFYATRPRCSVTGSLRSTFLELAEVVAQEGFDHIDTLIGPCFAAVLDFAQSINLSLTNTALQEEFALDFHHLSL